MLYLAIDGDDIGNHLEYSMLTNEVQSLIEFSMLFQSAMTWLSKMLQDKLGAAIILCEGDTLLATLPSDNYSIEVLEQMRAEFRERTESSCTLSAGVGSTPREAYLALKLAKAGGKDRIQLQLT
jgi:GTP cyclohydrolase III